MPRVGWITYNEKTDTTTVHVYVDFNRNNTALHCCDVLQDAAEKCQILSTQARREFHAELDRERRGR